MIRTLSTLIHRGEYRTYPTIQSRTSTRIRYKNQQFINFASNDYLSLSQHPESKKAFIQGIQQFGMGCSSSMHIAGYYTCQKKLEERFAEWLQVESVTFFSSGYLANLGVVNALVNSTSKIVFDQYCHASIIDGIRLSNAKFKRYPHQDFERLSCYLRASKITHIITESLFSMSGMTTAFEKLKHLIRSQYCIIDDSHGLGILGESGTSTAKHMNQRHSKNNVLIASLGKAFNAHGAIVAGSRDVIQEITQLARTQRYTNHLPPAIFSLIQENLSIIQRGKHLRRGLQALIQFFNYRASELHLPLLSIHQTPIRCIKIGCNFKVKKIQKKLLNDGFYIAAICSPTVKHGEACLRISLNAQHTVDEIDNLLTCIKKYHELF